MRFNKNIYGNRDKVGEVISKSKFIFGQPTMRKLLEGVSIVENEPVNCEITGEETCSPIMEYGILNDQPTQENFVYNWYIKSGNAAIITDQYYPTVLVQSIDSAVDETFELGCNVIDDYQSRALLIESFTHRKVLV